MLRIAAPTPNRRARRIEAAKVARFLRHSAGSLDTAFLRAGQSLDAHPHAGIFTAALGDFNRGAQGLFCFCCKSDFSTERQPAAFLFSCSAVKPRIASLAGICLPCFETLPADEIEAHCARVLSTFIPGGIFLDNDKKSTAAPGQGYGGKEPFNLDSNAPAGTGENMEAGELHASTQ